MNRKILLGEEDAPVRMMLGRVLRAAGYDVLLAANGREALAEARHSHPDLVLMDLKTPGPQGWEPFEQIRRAIPHVPVIATTAWSNQLEQAVQRGIDTLMEKPLDLALLLSGINELLSESAQDRKERKQKQQAEFDRAAA